MVPIGLIDRVNDAAYAIDFGRKGFAIRGKEQEGRILFEEGIAVAMATFKEVQASADPYTIILAEYTFLTQEYQLCGKSDKDSIDTLKKAIESFDDAFLALKAVENIAFYKSVDNVFPHNRKYRVKGFPKDSFHIACNSHKVRIKNILRASGIDSIEKSLLKMRYENMITAINAYVELQRKAMGNEELGIKKS